MGTDDCLRYLVQALVNFDPVAGIVVPTAVSIADISNAEYETVAASQTAQIMGTTGAPGDFFNGIIIVPAAAAVGAISIIDGATSISILSAGTLVDVKPFYIPLNMKAVTGPWKVTTGNSVSVIAVGNFT